MARFVLILILLIGAASAWNYSENYLIEQWSTSFSFFQELATILIRGISRVCGWRDPRRSFQLHPFGQELRGLVATRWLSPINSTTTTCSAVVHSQEKRWYVIWEWRTYSLCSSSPAHRYRQWQDGDLPRPRLTVDEAIDLWLMANVTINWLSINWGLWRNSSVHE